MQPDNKLQFISVLLLVLTVVSCGKAPEQAGAYSELVEQALGMTGQDMESISLPKVPYPVSTLARLSKVDAVMSHPPAVIDLGLRLRNTGLSGTRSEYIADIIQLLDIGNIIPQPDGSIMENVDDAWKALLNTTDTEGALPESPAEWRSDATIFTALKSITIEIAHVRQAWEKYGGQLTTVELDAINAHLKKSITYTGTDPDAFRLIPKDYHRIGERVVISSLASALLQLFSTVESALPLLAQANYSGGTLEWETPLGLIRIAGDQDNRHEGHFLLLIDFGGDDTYVNVGADPEPGNVTVVIDLAGDDEVRWNKVPGPGSGVLGMGIWLDMEGNDHYRGGNMGLGAALFGGGIFWDESGDDSYDAGFLAQGVGQYGVGIFVDAQGNDSYQSSMSGQGFGGPGGVGILVDFNGNDRYTCGGKIPDWVQARVRRHTDIRYLSMCQGYGFGLRPEVSGGIGLLIDHSGEDEYKADIFAQGGAYWFGLGMLIDGSGNDHYEAYEHCQGESLHLGAGFLGDWGGNDTYIGYEHCQGVGMDRASGVLYDDSGDDNYSARYESQGTGLKPYGVGILIDSGGDDHYDALRDSQGYAKPDLKFPESQWPTGILLDLQGSDTFVQPYSDAVDSAGRIQNRQGVAVDK